MACNVFGVKKKSTSCIMTPSVRSVTTSYPLDLWKEAVASCLHGSLQILGLWEAEVVSLARIHPETFGGL